jgi:hypothetical protein
MRRGELSGLRWSDIRADRIVLEAVLIFSATNEEEEINMRFHRRCPAAERHDEPDNGCSLEMEQIGKKLPSRDVGGEN